jgi:alkaline phosphatase
MAVAVAVGLTVVVCVGAALGVYFVFFARRDSTPATLPDANVVLFIGDGMGPQAISLARLVAAYRGIADPLRGFVARGTSSLMTTHSATNDRTDSAAAATAMACGIKTRNGAVGMLANGSSCLTVLEAAV